MIETGGTRGDWARLRASGAEGAAWALAERALARVADRVFARERIDPDRYGDVIDDTLALMMSCTTAADRGGDEPLDDWAERVLTACAHRERRAEAKARSLSEGTRAIGQYAAAEPDFDAPDLEPLPPMTAEERATVEAVLNLGVSEAARTLGTSRSAIYALLERLRNRKGPSPPPQAADRSWALDAAAFEESRERREWAAMLRAYAEGREESGIGREHGKSAGAMKTWIHRRRHDHLKRQRRP